MYVMDVCLLSHAHPAWSDVIQCDNDCKLRHASVIALPCSCNTDRSTCRSVCADESDCQDRLSCDYAGQRAEDGRDRQGHTKCRV